jgi:hypothetical protein
LNDSDFKILKTISLESTAEKTMSTTVFHKYNEIGHLLNGYARVVIYETTAFNVITNKYDPLFSPNMNRPISMDEG